MNNIPLNDDPYTDLEGVSREDQQAKISLLARQIANELLNAHMSFRQSCFAAGLGLRALAQAIATASGTSEATAMRMVIDTVATAFTSEVYSSLERIPRTKKEAP